MVSSFPSFDAQLVVEYILAFLKFPDGWPPFNVRQFVGRPRWVTMLVRRFYDSPASALDADAVASDIAARVYEHYARRLTPEFRIAATAREPLVKAAYRAVMMGARFKSSASKAQLPDDLQPTEGAARLMEELLCTFESI